MPSWWWCCSWWGSLESTGLLVGFWVHQMLGELFFFLLLLLLRLFCGRGRTT